MEGVVTLSSVKELNIKQSLCFQKYPCFHRNLAIVLNDGREKNFHLSGVELEILASALPREKVIGQWCRYDSDTLSEYSPSSLSTTPEAVLASIF